MNYDFTVNEEVIIKNEKPLNKYKIKSITNNKVVLTNSGYNKTVLIDEISKINFYPNYFKKSGKQIKTKNIFKYPKNRLFSINKLTTTNMKGSKYINISNKINHHLIDCECWLNRIQRIVEKMETYKWYEVTFKSLDVNIKFFDYKYYHKYKLTKNNIIKLEHIIDSDSVFNFMNLQF